MGNSCRSEPRIAGIVDNVPAYYNKGINFGSHYIKINERNIYTGVKFQCVEYARRYLALNFGVIFEDVSCAYHIFDLSTVTHLHSQEKKQFISFPQGSTTPPQKGDLIIYQKSGKQWWGHVAVVTNVENDQVSLAEQNYDEDWDHKDFSRQVKLTKIGNGYHLTNDRSYKPHTWDVRETIIGWKRVE